MFNYTKDDSFTVTAWVKVPSYANRWQAVISKGRDTASWYGLWISGDNKWVYGANGNNLYGATATPGWHHIALVQDGQSNTRYLYVDGIAGSGTTSVDGSTLKRFMIGACDGVNESFTGKIDEVSVYNYCLKANNVAYEKAIYDHKLNVQTYTQQPYNSLCWATSASMTISYFLEDLIDRKVDIAKDKYGATDFNHGAYMSDIIYYINKYTGRSGVNNGGTLTFSQICSKIDSQKPIPYTIYWTGGGGHALVMRGYDIYGTSNYVEINDPWDGQLHIINYDYLKSNSSYTWNGYASY